MSTSPSSSESWKRENTVCASDGAHELDDIIVLECELERGRQESRLAELIGDDWLSKGVVSVASVPGNACV